VGLNVVNPRFPSEWGATYTGSNGDLIVTGGDGGCDTEQKAKDYKPQASGFNAFMESVDTDPTERHRQNWRRCIKTRELPAMDVGIGVQVITLPIIGNISWQLGRKLTFDMKTMRFIGDAEANRFLSEPYRAPWALEKI
jgi:hypothetical protein